MEFIALLTLIVAELSIIQFTKPIIKFRQATKLGGWAFKTIVIMFMFILTLKLIEEHPELKRWVSESLISANKLIKEFDLIKWSLYQLTPFLKRIRDITDFVQQNDQLIIKLGMLLISYMLFKLVLNPVKYSWINSSRYATGCSKIIKSGIQGDLIDLGEELYCSINVIAKIHVKDQKLIHKIINRINVAYIKFKLRGYKKIGDSGFVRENSLLKVLSDPLFCKVLVLHVPQVFEGYILKLKQKKMIHIGLLENMNFLRQLINQAFQNEDSIFYREKLKTKEREKTFLALVFEDYWFVSRNIVNTQHSDSAKMLAISSNDSLEKIKMYCKILRQVISAYKDSFKKIYKKAGEGKARLLPVHAKSDQITSDTLFFMLRRLNDCIRWTIHEDSSFRRPDTILKIKVVIEVYSHLLQAVHSLDKAELNEKLGKVLFNFLVGFSFVEANDDSFPRVLFLNTLEGKSSRSSCKTRNILKNKIFEQLKNDLTLNIHPRILRPMLTIFDLQNADNFIGQETQQNDDDFQLWEISFKKDLYNYLCTYFEKAAQQNEFLVTKGLPSHITYDSSKGVLIQTSYSGEKIEISLGGAARK